MNLLFSRATIIGAIWMFLGFQLLTPMFTGVPAAPFWVNFPMAFLASLGTQWSIKNLQKKRNTGKPS